MHFRLFVFGVILAGLILPVNSLRAQVSPLPDPPNSANGQLVIRPGEEVRCFALRGGEQTASLAYSNRLLKTTSLPRGITLIVPPAKYILYANNSGSTLLLEAVRSGVPEYLIRSLNPAPVYFGGPVTLPDSRSPEQIDGALCAPYPVTSISMTNDSIIRGQTMIITLETAEPIECEAQYLGHSEPCYASDDTHYHILLGVSALENPGIYNLRLQLAGSHYLTALDLPFSVSEGKYGFQYISPPSAVSALLDETAFRAEEDYLKPYRGVRTPKRHWSLPLTYPLTVQLSISADFGYRRSYGGMFDGYHSGVDYRAWSGLPVLAPEKGVVILNQYLQARGNAVLIDHGWGLVSGFWHLSESNVEIGQLVERGEIIGKVGNTGLSTGSHLHWETWVNGVSVDAKQWLDSQNFGDAALNLMDY